MAPQASKERVGHIEAAAFKTELEAMLPMNVREVVRNLIGLVNAQLRTVVAEAESKEAGNGDHGQPRFTGNLRSDSRETCRRRQLRRNRFNCIEIKASIPSAKFVQSGCSKA